MTLQKPFLWSERKCNKLEQTLKAFAEQKSTLELSADGFNHFGRSVIYIDIQPNNPLWYLHADLKKLLKNKLGFSNKMLGHQTFKPHITLASRDLKSSQFNEAWNYISSFDFKTDFICEKLWLLQHDGKRWYPSISFQLCAGCKN